MIHKPEIDDMALPAGFTCHDCFAFNFCRGIGVAKAEQIRCDWAPSRFRARSQVLQEMKMDARRLDWLRKNPQAIGELSFLSLGCFRMSIDQKMGAAA